MGLNDCCISTCNTYQGGCALKARKSGCSHKGLLDGRLSELVLQLRELGAPAVFVHPLNVHSDEKTDKYVLQDHMTVAQR